MLGAGWASADSKSSALGSQQQRKESVGGEILLFPSQKDPEQQVLGEQKPCLGGFPSHAREECRAGERQPGATVARLIGRAPVAELRAALLTRKAFKSKGKKPLKAQLPRGSLAALQPPTPDSAPPPSPGSAAEDQRPKLPREGTQATAGPLRGERNPQLDVHKASCSPHHP